MFNKLIMSMLVVLSCVGCAQTKLNNSEIIETELSTQSSQNEVIKSGENFEYKNEYQVNNPVVSSAVAEATIPQKVQATNSYVAPPFLSTAPTQFVGAVSLGDSLTTHIALAGGAVEQNGLINTSPAGLAALFVAKMGITYYIDKQPEPVRNQGLKMMAGLWGGVNVNNLLVIAGASNPVSLIGGVLAGIGAYYYEEKLLEEEKKRQLETQITK